MREAVSEGDGDVDVFPTCTVDVIALPIAGNAMAGALDPREILDVEVGSSSG